jgi:hypothetical protein
MIEELNEEKGRITVLAGKYRHKFHISILWRFHTHTRV